jgi:YHS domain-containing protein
MENPARLTKTRSEKGILEVKIPAALACILIALLCGIALSAGGDASQIRWAPDLVAAREASAKFKVPMLVHFYGDACLPCKTLEQRVFSQPEVVGTLNKYFICVSVNATRQPGVASEFAVHSWPTDVFISPDGEILFRGICPQDPRTYMGILNSVAVMNRDRNLLVAGRQQQAESGGSRSAASSTGSIPSERGPDSPLVNSSLPVQGGSQQARPDQHQFYNPSEINADHNRLGRGATAHVPVQSGPLSPSLQPSTITNSTHASMHQVAETQRGGMNQDVAAFPPLPGLEPTRPVREAQDNRDYLSTMQAVPQTGGLPHIATPATAQQGAHSGRFPGHLASTVKVQTGRNHLTTSDVGGLSEQWIEIIEDREPTPPDNIAGYRPLGSEFETSSMTDSGAEESQTLVPCLDGYCPVSLRQQQWVPGQSRFAVKHLGQVYHMANQAAFEQFLSHPNHFAPMLSGADPLVLLTQGKIIPGSTQHGLFEENTGQVLLFSSDDSKKQFQQNFDQHMNSLQVLTQRALSVSSAAE